MSRAGLRSGASPAWDRSSGLVLAAMAAMARRVRGGGLVGTDHTASQRAATARRSPGFDPKRLILGCGAIESLQQLGWSGW